MSKHPTKTSQSSAASILKSASKFQLYSYLKLYPELNLNQLADLVNKSKSTVHLHLQKMIENGLVEVSRTEKIRSDREKHYYCLSKRVHAPHNFEESDHAPQQNQLNEKARYCEEVLPTYQAFTNQQLQYLKLWKLYLNTLEQLYSEGKIEEVYNSLSSVKNPENLPEYEAKKQHKEFYNYGNLMSVSFFQPRRALKFVETTENLHNELEMEQDDEIRDDPETINTLRPIYAGLTILPMKHILDFLNKHQINTKKFRI